MELEDKENGDVIEGEDQLGWSFFILGFSLLNALHMSFSVNVKSCALAN